jgi:hypothetical protein
MEQSAVEWLINCLSKYDSKMIELFYKEIEQAKEMEKQNIIDAFESGVYDGGENVSQYNMNSEQYYIETFKNK